MTNPLTKKKRANKIGKDKKTKLADSSLGPVFGHRHTMRKGQTD